MRNGRAIVVVSLALTLGACAADRVPVAPTAAPTPSTPVRAGPTCDGTVASTPYASFASMFNARQTRRAAAQFAGRHAFAWWDPSDPPGGTQTLDQLADHLGLLYHLGVRLPAEIEARPADNRPGEGGFVWDDDRGYSGKGSIDCQTAKFTYLVIEGWTTAIADRAPASSTPA